MRRTSLGSRLKPAVTERCVEAGGFLALFMELGRAYMAEAAARDGFTGVEYMSPYEFEASEIDARLRAHGLEQVLFNTPAGGLERDGLLPLRDGQSQMVGEFADQRAVLEPFGAESTHHTPGSYGFICHLMSQLKVNVIARF